MGFISRGFRGKRRDALCFPDVRDQGACFFQGGSGVGIAAPDSHVAENCQCRNAADRRCARVPQHSFRIFAGAIPLNLFEPRPRSPGEHVQAPRIQVVIVTVRDSIAQIASASLVVTPEFYESGGVALPFVLTAWTSRS